MMTKTLKILNLILEIVKGTNKAWDDVLEPWRFCVAVGVVAIMSAILPDPGFLIFVILLILWRMLGGAFKI